jgi:hypothetical protein
MTTMHTQINKLKLSRARAHTHTHTHTHTQRISHLSSDDREFVAFFRDVVVQHSRSGSRYRCCSAGCRGPRCGLSRPRTNERQRPVCVRSRHRVFGSRRRPCIVTNGFRHRSSTEADAKIWSFLNSCYEIVQERNVTQDKVQNSWQTRGTCCPEAKPKRPARGEALGRLQPWTEMGLCDYFPGCYPSRLPTLCCFQITVARNRQ